MHSITIKRIDFPEFNRTILAVGDRPLCELDDMRLAADIATRLQAALPHSTLQHGAIAQHDIIDLLGYCPAIAARNSLTCHPNDTEIADAWDTWFNDSPEADLLDLFDQKYEAIARPTLGPPNNDTTVLSHAAIPLAEALGFEYLKAKIIAKEVSPAG